VGETDRLMLGLELSVGLHGAPFPSVWFVAAEKRATRTGEKTKREAPLEE
jgi:hypothetical protein